VATNQSARTAGTFAAVPTIMAREPTESSRKPYGYSLTMRFQMPAYPLVPAEIDPQHGLRGIDRFGHADGRVPRQAVDELGERIAVSLKFVIAKTGVVEVRECEVALEAPAAAVELFQVREDEGLHIRGCDRLPRRGLLRPGAPASIHFLMTAMSEALGRGDSPGGGMVPS